MSSISSVEDRLAEWAKQPGTFVTAPERQFIEDMRTAARCGVGYGWMQQIIEWEWQSKAAGSFGPGYFQSEITRLERKLKHLQDVLEARGTLDDPAGFA